MSTDRHQSTKPTKQGITLPTDNGVEKNIYANDHVLSEYRSIIVGQIDIIILDLGASHQGQIDQKLFAAYLSLALFWDVNICSAKLFTDSFFPLVENLSSLNKNKWNEAKNKFF